LPDSIIKIGKEAFKNCKGLKSITLPVNIETLGDYAFCEAGLEDVVIPDSVSEIGSFAFAGHDRSSNSHMQIMLRNDDVDKELIKESNSALLSVTIPRNATIGKMAFHRCSKLSKVTFKNSSNVTASDETKPAIGNGAFSGCIALTNIELPSNLNAIGGKMNNSDFGVFEGCTGLKSIVIPSSVGGIWPKAFKDCTGLVQVDFADNNNINVISHNVFKGCAGLVSILIPPNVEFIGDSAFQGCTRLESVEFASNNKLEGINKLTFSGCASLKTFNFPDTVTIIKERAFFGCTSLASTVSLKSIKEIGDNAFGGCASLTKLDICHNDAAAIGSRAFTGCVKLSTVRIPSNATVGFKAFDGCPGNPISNQLQVGMRNFEFGNHYWRVLDIKKGAALIITEQILYNCNFNGINPGTKWSNCDLRRVLNHKDYNFMAQFSQTERARICRAITEKANSPHGRDIVDEVFLLSLGQAKTYFSNDADRMAILKYTDKNNKPAEKYSSWWLRTPAESHHPSVSTVRDDGTFGSVEPYVVPTGGRAEWFGDGPYANECGLRPAMWIRL